MIDANSQFFAILTNVGMAKQANADALGLPWKFTDMGVGDANNTDPIPSATQTALINEWRRRPLNQVRVDPVNPAVIIAEQIIPADEGGHWIREIGLYDADGDLVAVANCAPSFKPVLSQGSGRTQVVRMNFVVSSTGNITLKIDPSVVLATREYVDTRIMEELYKLDSKQSVRVATTANIALAGLQVLDGVTLLAGDRVLVKNQTVAKDNGIYIAGAPAWVRAPDADTNAEVTSALLVSVEQGTALADTRWQLVTDGVIVLGATALTFQNITQGFAPINSPALLGAPTALTPPQFDSSLRLVNTAFAKRMGVEYSGFAPLTASTALGASSIGGIVSAASATPISITLPPTAGVPEGASVAVVNAGAGAVTVLAAGLDVLASQVAGVIPVVLGMGDNAGFVKVSGTWRLRGGSMALKYAAVMSGPNWTTQPQFANDTSFATTAFSKRMGVEYSSFSSNNASQAMTVSAVGGLHSFSSDTPLTVTLPATSAVGPAATVTIVSAGAGAVTIAAAAGDIVYTSSGQIGSIVLALGDTAEFIRLGGQWRLIGGTLALKFAGVMSGAHWTTQPQFTNDKSFATTEFVKRHGLQFSSQAFITANTVLTAAHLGALVETSAVGTLTLTLPATTVAPGGGAIWFFNDSPADVIINRVGADIIAVNSAVSLTTITLKPGDTLVLATNGGTKWLAVGGSAQLGYSGAFGSLLAVNGYQKLPSGKMEMWGSSGLISSGSSLDITLPSTFPIEGLEAFATPNGGGNITASISFSVSIISPSVIRIYHFHGAGGSANYRYHVVGR